MGTEESSSSTHSCTSSEIMFSFPGTPTQDQFEFGAAAVTPETTSPADRLFSNGRLLPHRYDFPCRTTSLKSQGAITSRTSSVNSSRDSFLSSRSSSCSARTSSCSDDSDRMRVLNYYTRVCSKRSGMVTAGSKRWQYITPVPAAGRTLKRDLSSGRKKQVHDKLPGMEEKKRDKAAGGREVRWRRFLRLLCLACEECHAMEPSKKHDLLTHP